MMNKDMFEDEIDHLVKLGGQCRDLSRAKEVLHNTTAHSEGNGRSAENQMAARQEHILDAVNEIQGRLWEAFEEAERTAIFVNGTLSSSSLSDDSAEEDQAEPSISGTRLSIENLKEGDVVNVLAEGAAKNFYRVVVVPKVSAPKGDFRYGVAFAWKDKVLQFVGSDDIYLVERPKRRLPNEPGTWVMVTGYDDPRAGASIQGDLETPFLAVRRYGDMFWATEHPERAGHWGYTFDQQYITDWHEVEFTAKGSHESSE